MCSVFVYLCTHTNTAVEVFFCSLLLLLLFNSSGLVVHTDKDSIHDAGVVVYYSHNILNQT